MLSLGLAPAAAIAQPPADAPLIVIDPGHGGANTGAPGAEPGVYEKRETLAMARCVAERLRAAGFRVALTRERDEYVSLRDRVRRAHALGADRFVSIHFNATERHDQRGYETYVLTPEAIEVDAPALRYDDGPARAGVDRRTAALLDDVERSLALPASAALALRVQRALRSVRGPEGDRGVRQDAMHVLLGLTMPAVLVEVGFLDHPIEGPQLRRPDTRAAICEALASAMAGP